ncbi:hypothetical protein [Pontibacter sp. G13]|uniref:hypothetical protein n=1 Tax=Pontibacter sp. G13 TaxID=3074898 RepID=UPI00288AAC55|nr:hypothetical protein [Pontibacter sp. G13]WNJ21292.1 hypothetical protein RJD25_12555 [Pontibacter sp. G13]
MNKFMRIAGFALLFAAYSCNSSGEKSSDIKTPPQAERVDPSTLPVRIPDPSPEVRKTIQWEPFSTTYLDETLNFLVPRGTKIRKDEGTEGFLLYGMDGRYQLMVELTENDLDYIRQSWQDDQYEGFTFSQFLVEAPFGVLVEVAKEGMLEYQTEAIYKQGDLKFRLFSNRAESFAHSEASNMFQTIRKLAH